MAAHTRGASHKGIRPELHARSQAVGRKSLLQNLCIKCCERRVVRDLVTRSTSHAGSVRVLGLGIVVAGGLARPLPTSEGDPQHDCPRVAWRGDLRTSCRILGPALTCISFSCSQVVNRGKIATHEEAWNIRSHDVDAGREVGSSVSRERRTAGASRKCQCAPKRRPRSAHRRLKGFAAYSSACAINSLAVISNPRVILRTVLIDNLYSPSSIAPQ